MKADKQQLIKKQITAKHFTAIIDKVRYIVEADKALKDTLLKKIEAYNKKNSEAKLKEIIRLLTPKKEKEKALKVVEKKKLHHKKKELKETIQEANSELSQGLVLVGTLTEETEKLFKGNKLFTIKDKNLYLKPFEKVRLPQTLVNRVIDFIKAGTDLTPLVNFWKLALLNPNEIARTKLFDYLANQNITITPRGYIVTYRMVKTTDKKTKEGKPIYTSAYTKQEEYVMGTAYSIPRKDCDEDGSRDCSRGLHTGTHKFIGILVDKKTDFTEGETVGQGYGKGVKITTKMETPDSYGTGYDRPKPREVETQHKFDNSFGNQAVICLVNPMHVVSIPDSNTRKMRSCELFFCGETTPEEVIDLVEKDYHIFDHAYYQYELEEINKMLSQTKLKEYVDNVAAAKSIKKKQEAQAALDEVSKKLTLGKENLNNNQISSADLFALIKSRIVKPKQLK